MEPIKDILGIHAERHERARHEVRKLKSRLMFERHWTDRVADFLTGQFGTVWFLIWHAAFFLGWVEWNLGLLPFPIFDPFPFGLLTMAVSLEAIFLAIIVLISQNRQNKIADMRQQIDFEIDVRAEAEVTKILRMLEDIEHHLHMRRKDPELEEMEQDTDINELLEEMQRHYDY